MGFGTRTPTSNEPPREPGENPWLETSDGVDAFALKLNGEARNCRGPCGRLTSVKHLNPDGWCPDCCVQ